MKLTHETKTRDLSECVAYITPSDNLVFKSNYHGTGIWLDPDDGEVDKDWEFSPEEGVTHFFPGDSITITF